MHSIGSAVRHSVRCSPVHRRSALSSCPLRTAQLLSRIGKSRCVQVLFRCQRLPLVCGNKLLLAQFVASRFRLGILREKGTNTSLAPSTLNDVIQRVSVGVGPLTVSQSGLIYLQAIRVGLPGAPMSSLPLPSAESPALGIVASAEPSSSVVPKSPQPSVPEVTPFKPPTTPNPQSQSHPVSDHRSPHTNSELSVPQDFDLEKAVVSYGFFMAAPNRWLFPPGQENGCFERPLRLADGRAVWVRIGPMDAGRVGVLPVETGVAELGTEDKEGIEAQVRRMLRLLPEDAVAVAEFQSMHQAAKASKYGRLLRSPTLWEDMVKTQLLCNCGWGRTLSMNRALCQLQAELNGPPLGCPPELSHLGDFPTAAELQSLKPPDLAKKCGLGYRAIRLVNLAQGVVTGAYDLGQLEGPGRLPRAPELLAAVRKMPGFGPFSAANVMQCLGEYDTVAADSETVRHIREVHGRLDCDLTNVEAVVAEVYKPFAPYQFLAYWYEIWQEYEALFGPLCRMSADDYGNITGRNMSKKDDGKNKKQPRKRAPKEASAKKRVASEVGTMLEAGITEVAGTAVVETTEVLVTDPVVGAPGTPAVEARRSARKKGRV